MVDASRIVALLGPTNTGKTHHAIERMLEHDTGMIGLPLRLLAREVYDRVAVKVGSDQVALITGEEKIVPRRARYFVSTVEAMPVHKDLEFVAVDEIQLAAHRERGHVFTDRLLYARGTRETWLLGSHSMRHLVRALVPTAQIDEHPRLSELRYAGVAKLSRTPPRSAVVAFSMDKVYEFAERLRAMRGGAAVVLGALSPRTRNAQVAMFQAGEVDHLVATDAIGMGLNLDLSHVAFAARHKFDGRELRELEDAELAQIAGRAGRYVADGTFGSVAPVELSLAAVAAVESHRVPSVHKIRFRPHELDFSSKDALLASLRARPHHPALVPIERPDDEAAFERLVEQPDVRALLGGAGSASLEEERVRLLWDVASIPDFRKLLFEAYVDDLRSIFVELATRGRIESDFMAAATRGLGNELGEVEVLLGRVAALRTWSYVANKDEWLEEPLVWQGATRELEDRLSDALHAALTRRFVAETSKRRRTARTRPALTTSRTVPSGDAPSGRAAPGASSGRARSRFDENEWHVPSGHPFARLKDFVVADRPSGPAKLEDDWAAWIDAADEAFELDDRGTILADKMPVAHLVRGARITLPGIRLIDRPDLSPSFRPKFERRVLGFARHAVVDLLAPIQALKDAPSASVRGLCHLLEEGLGTVLRSDANVEALVRELSPDDHVLLANQRIVVGRLTVYAKDLGKGPAVRRRALLLRTAERRVPEFSPSRTSLPKKGDVRTAVALGFVPIGPLVVRADVAERIADGDGGEALDSHRIASLLGCSARDAERVRRALVDARVIESVEVDRAPREAPMPLAAPDRLRSS